MSSRTASRASATGLPEGVVLLSSPAALRNRGPILELLRTMLPDRGLVLELASGSGEHVLHFAEHLPALCWQPSDPSAAARQSVDARVRASGLGNIRPALAVDASIPERWPLAHADAMLAINLVHISPKAATAGLLQGAARLLPAGAPLVLYGPYLEDDVETAASNLAFDADLKARNSAWGLRRREEVEALAEATGLRSDGRHLMPANNLLLLFRRT